MQKISTTTNNEESPAIAFGGSNYLVVWEDNFFPETIKSQLLKINGTVSGSNKLVSKKGMANPISFCKNPDVTFNGKNFVVVFVSIFTNKQSIDFQYVDIAGDKDGLPIPINSNSTPKSNPRIAFDGTNCLVAWNENASEIRGQLIDGYYHLIGNDFPISSNINKVYPPAVSFGVNKYLVVWIEKEQVWGRVIDKTGDVGGIPFEISTEAKAFGIPSIAFDGSNFLVVWEDRRSWVSGNQSKSDIYGQFLSATGTLNGNNIPICTSPNLKSYPAITFCSSRYFLVWSDNRKGNWDIYGQYINKLGKLEGANLNLVNEQTDQQKPDIVYGKDPVIVWQDMRNGNWDIYSNKAVGCFIATAAYGSPFAPEVQLLRDVRDDCFNKINWGVKVINMFERFYYKFSPKIASTMMSNKTLGRLIRWIIVAPIVRILSFYISINKYVNPDLLKSWRIRE
jgi:hypothetical protein